MKYYVDLAVGDIKFDDLADLFFAGVFYWMAWIAWEWYGIAFLTFVFLIRLRKVPGRN